MPAPRKFTREQLRTVALAMVDEEGLAALTMRSLASALGTGAMTIYNYVDGREGLEQLVTEAVMAEARWDDPAGDWTEAVAAVAVGMWRAVRAHPQAIPLILTRRSLDPATLLAAEALLDALARGGRSGADLLIAFRVVTGFVSGFSQSELASPLAPDHGDDSSTATDHIRSLPADRFPRLIAIAEAATGSDPETEFRAGLSIILTGLHSTPKVG
ncbi:TetR/AcrR family transcriptional regulator C-terminal domain-containing protein [Kribbella albertanoniae]|uniref:TetR/AcrR family transcriptional regulator n=1 Tax=Kribbella albertanoniae TaxID=1266829 RepID=A0A4R4Q8X5_9ACTN|nr:TetR/AcrR family transcriptional regulator [Kribbella albertanoniae]TDC31704.1 TetR/AcrR family transcriptional regulator [Kribbella albertanoniae]